MPLQQSVVTVQETQHDIGVPRLGYVWQAAREYQSLGLKVLPLMPGSGRRYDLRPLAYIDKFEDRQLPVMFGGQNIGVELGSRSHNLFVIVADSPEGRQRIEAAFRRKVTWVSRNREQTLYWFLCSDGAVQNEAYDDCELIGKGVLPLPPSSYSNGEACTWEAFSSSLPAAIDSERLRKFAPRATARKQGKLPEPGNRINIRHGVVRDCLLWLEERPWKGRREISKKKVYAAMLRRADIEGPRNFRASAREIALLAGVTPATASKAIRWLIDDGLIELVDDAKPEGHRYRLVPQSPSSAEDPSDLWQFGHMGLWTNNNHGAFYRKAFGPGAQDVFNCLIKLGEATAKELTAASGRCSKTVKNALKKFIAADLVEMHAEKYRLQAKSLELLDEVALAHDTTGQLQHKREQYARQRRLFTGKKLQRILRRPGRSNGMWSSS